MKTVKGKEKRPVHPRWNDTSGISVIYRATEEERKKATWDEKVQREIVKRIYGNWA